ncbi:hypothetical protein [Streptomyces sp. NPDC048663]|uniref:hypothetical protein n=1 Tax=Streptomyces sp. NPDC048663 TaxID=3155638 RepID=UPI00344571C2
MGADESTQVSSHFYISGDSSSPYGVNSSRAQRKRSRTDRLTVAMAAIVTIFLIVNIWLPDGRSSETKKDNGGTSNPLNTPWFSWVIGIVIIVAIISAVLYLVTRRQYMANENKRYNQILKAEEEYKQEVLEKLRKETELATLMGLNQGQINEYHRIVTEQADKAFRSSRIAMGVGLFLLVSAAFAGAYVPLEEVRWFIGALAAFSTLLSGYLTKTYLALYKESIGQLNRYFDQPVLNSHYLTAERLAEALQGQDATEVRRKIIDEVLAASTKVGANDRESNSKPHLDNKKAKKRNASKRHASSSAHGKPT